MATAHSTNGGLSFQYTALGSGDVLPPGATVAAVNVTQYGQMVAQVTGITGGTIAIQASMDGINYVAMPIVNMATGLTATTIIANGFYTIPLNYIYLKFVAATVTGPAIITGEWQVPAYATSSESIIATNGFPVTSFVPTAANILCGNRGTIGAIITIPQNRTWQGWIDLTVALASTASAAALATGGTISTTGVTVTPAAGPVLASRVATALQLATTTDSSTNSGRIFLTVAAGSDAGGATLTLAVGTATTCQGSAAGVLIA